MFFLFQHRFSEWHITRWVGQILHCMAAWLLSEQLHIYTIQLILHGINSIRLDIFPSEELQNIVYDCPHIYTLSQSIVIIQHTS